jgi:ssDNA-binding Zn-finger/Zn-ribbon topoisomerase 1
MLPPDQQEQHMPQAYPSEPSLLSIERPRCPKCQGRMMLARIERGPVGSDLRTFECPKCEHVQKMLVEDPMKSTKAGWQNSGLKAPE